MAKKALILGGYGNTGRLIAEILLKETDAGVVIGGRSLEKAEAEADRLNRLHESGRVSAVRVDAADKKSLHKAFSKVDIAVVASSTIQYAENTVGAAVDAGIDYFDNQISSPQKLNALWSYESEVVRKGLCFITDGGFHPGLPALLVRYAKQKFHLLKKSRCRQPDIDGLAQSGILGFDPGGVFGRVQALHPPGG